MSSPRKSSSFPGSFLGPMLSCLAGSEVSFSRFGHCLAPAMSSLPRLFLLLRMSASRCCSVDCFGHGALADFALAPGVIPDAELVSLAPPPKTQISDVLRVLEAPRVTSPAMNPSLDLRLGTSSLPSTSSWDFRPGTLSPLLLPCVFRIPCVQSPAMFALSSSICLCLSACFFPEMFLGLCHLIIV